MAHKENSRQLSLTMRRGHVLSGGETFCGYFMPMLSWGCCCSSITGFGIREEAICVLLHPVLNFIITAISCLGIRGG